MPDDPIDLERASHDPDYRRPDYRRKVIAWLKRGPVDAAATAGPPEAASDIEADQAPHG